MRVQVAILGGGPSGLALARLLGLAGVEAVVLERRDRAHVLSRIRAGVLEWGSADLLRAAGVGARMDAEGQVHDGTVLASDGTATRIDFRDLVGRSVMVYGQTEVTRDLCEALDRDGPRVIHGAEVVAVEGLEDARARVIWQDQAGARHEVAADWVAGCDGFHGAGRRTMAAGPLKAFERVYPFGWLGVLTERPPASAEVLYARHDRGFALASMRNPRLSRYYIQVPEGTRAEAWSDDAFWDELRRRLPTETAEALRTGPALEKSVAPLRSYVGEPMRRGRLFLCGDAAHIVPPTGAKGLNLALGDVRLLAEALIPACLSGDLAGVEAYSARALDRVWQAERFSWWMTTLMHLFPESGAFGLRMQRAELAHLARSRAARQALAEAYTGVSL
ncbi:p-hydroxybenzoate 3-monooxygenase [Albimonas donghaensis]|uniref:p-hydroxybenzoate 3-monooxygenase n=1 Tax=Albimonas donghaensis TaxID=356660 RepID=A0A1H2T3E6_9RHOB|nr:4-hydroxybenzoate 3-monooxygenase [Albimonas donghaensis]SDW38378.1 p-hydroxybenzoate 3-monooxygenase [Albimonas donghaensis]